MSMAGLGSVMLLSVERGSFAVAGTVSAIYALSAAVIGPQISRLIDVVRAAPGGADPAGGARAGHRRDDRRRAGHHAELADLPARAGRRRRAAEHRARWSGPGGRRSCTERPCCAPRSPGSRWSTRRSSSSGRRWPPSSRCRSRPSAALILATVLLIVGTLLLLTQRSTEPKPVRPAARGTRVGPAILLPGVGGIAAIFVLLGGIFGSFEVTTVAFTRRGRRAGGGRPAARAVRGRVADRRADLRRAGDAGVAGPAVHDRGRGAGRGHRAAAVPGHGLAGRRSGCSSPASPARRC